METILLAIALIFAPQVPTVFIAADGTAYGWATANYNPGICVYHKDGRFQGGGYWEIPGTEGRFAKAYRDAFETQHQDGGITPTMHWLPIPQCSVGQVWTVDGCEFPDAPKWKPDPEENWL